MVGLSVTDNTKFYWTPRVLAIIISIFFSIFAFDVFDANTSVYEQILGFLIHLIPSFIILITLIIAWNHDLWGGILYNIIALITLLFFHTYEDILVFVLITLPFIVIAELFLFQWSRVSKFVK